MWFGILITKQMKDLHFLLPLFTLRGFWADLRKIIITYATLNQMNSNQN